MTMALEGRTVVGTERFGVFPLKGKLQNVGKYIETIVSMLKARLTGKSKKNKKGEENIEVGHLKRILGIQEGVKYTSADRLRYRRVKIMTDQDTDGSHIKGLLLQFFLTFGLLDIPDFVEYMITPLLKATRRRAKRPKTTSSKSASLDRKTAAAEQAMRALTAVAGSEEDEQVWFYTEEEKRNWEEERKKDGTLHLWDFKYYKGLGTSSSQEAIQYFSKLDEHTITFTHNGDPDKTKKAMALAFGNHSGATTERKKWVREATSMDSSSSVKEATSMDSSSRVKDATSSSESGQKPPTSTAGARKTITFHDFVHGELVRFSIASNVRAIPNLADGLKPSQQKVLYAFMKRPNAGQYIANLQLQCLTFLLIKAKKRSNNSLALLASKPTTTTAKRLCKRRSSNLRKTTLVATTCLC